MFSMGNDGGKSAASVQPEGSEADLSKGHVYEDIEEDWPPFLGKLYKTIMTIRLF
jgi:hypothetical protein